MKSAILSIFLLFYLRNFECSQISYRGSINHPTPYHQNQYYGNYKVNPSNPMQANNGNFYVTAKRSAAYYGVLPSKTAYQAELLKKPLQTASSAVSSAYLPTSKGVSPMSRVAHFYSACPSSSSPLYYAKDYLNKPSPMSDQKINYTPGEILLNGYPMKASTSVVYYGPSENHIINLPPSSSSSGSDVKQLEVKSSNDAFSAALKLANAFSLEDLRPSCSVLGDVNLTETVSKSKVVPRKTIKPKGKVLSKRNGDEEILQEVDCKNEEKITLPEGVILKELKYGNNGKLLEIIVPPLTEDSSSEQTDSSDSDDTKRNDEKTPNKRNTDDNSNNNNNIIKNGNTESNKNANEEKNNDESSKEGSDSLIQNKFVVFHFTDEKGSSKSKLLKLLSEM